MTSWKPTSLSCISSEGVARPPWLPTAPMKSPITLISGLSTLAAAPAAPPIDTGDTGSGGACANTGAATTAGCGCATAAGCGATAAVCCAFKVWTSVSSAWIRSSMAFMRFNSSVVSCAPSAVANRNAATDASMSLHGILRILSWFFDNRNNHPGAGVKPASARESNREGEWRRARGSRREQRFVGRAKIAGQGQPRHRQDRRETGRGHGLLQRPRPDVTQSATMFRTIVRMFRSERSRLRTDQGAEKEHYEQTPQCARSEEHMSEPQSRQYLVCRLLLEKKNTPWIAHHRVCGAVPASSASRTSRLV